MTSRSGSAGAPPGWYPDPHGAGQRYWNGSEWTGHTSGVNLVPAGWYPDPHGGGQRYWNGSGWTEHTSGVTVPAVQQRVSQPGAPPPVVWPERQPYKPPKAETWKWVVGGIVALAVIAGVTSDDSNTGDDNGSRDDAASEMDLTGQSQSEELPGANDDAAEREERRKRREARGRTGLVTSVVDGDTLIIAGVGRVRLIGIDTPERGQECYEEATDYLRGQVGGQTVRYRYQSDRTDPYDRALLDIFRDGRLVNLDIARAGWGEELTIAPNDRYADRMATAEAEARSAPRGRWAGCTTEPELEPEPDPQPAPSEPDEDSGGGGSLPPPPPDLDCSDVDGPVTVGPSDPHRLDADGDGVGCE